MASIPASDNLPAGTRAPFVGIYVVSHRNPAHAQPHEVRVSRLMILPECTICAGVRFSLRGDIVQAIEDNEFFLYLAPK
jgi:hypothetical protein